MTSGSLTFSTAAATVPGYWRDLRLRLVREHVDRVDGDDLDLVDPVGV
jgi:hypothetical protein